MELTSTKWRSIFASALAILAAVGLTATLTYALPPSSSSPSGTATRTVTLSPTPHYNDIIGTNLSSDCLSEVPDTLVLPNYQPQGNGTVTTEVNTQGISSANGIFSVNGTTTPGTPGYANVTLTANGTATVAGKTYWYVSFIPLFTSFSDEAYVNFQNVTFFLSSIVQYQYSGKNQAWEGYGNGTLLPVDFKISLSGATVMTAETSSGLPCNYFLPSFMVEWGGLPGVASWESYNQASIGTYDIQRNATVVVDQENIGFSTPTANPWFTRHTSPQAGISYQIDGGEITLYVSTS